MLKYYLFVLALLGSSLGLHAQRTYYIAANGDDSTHSGLSPDSPWKTIAQVNRTALQPGDSVLFRRGDVFEGELLPSQSGTAGASITYSSYGQGPRPLIRGSRVLTGWTQFQGNIWVTDHVTTLSALNNFFIAGVSQQIGRYPNANAANQGYLRIQSGNENNVLTDPTLAGQDWTGATAVIRVNLFLLNKPVIESHSGTTLTLAAPALGNYKVVAGYGYFIQNHLATLDQPGEWFYDKAAQKLYLYSTTDPDEFSTEAPVYSTGFSASGKSYLSVQQLAFSQSNDYGVRVDSTAGLLTSNIRIQHCSFENSHNAVWVNRASAVVVSDNDVVNTNNNALFITASDYECNRNQIRRTALRAGMGEPNNNQYNAINLVGRNAIAAHNRIDSVGYSGIRFEGTNLIVKNNWVSHFALVKCDVGGIYSFRGFAPPTYGYGNNQVIGNIVSEAYPNLFGTTSKVVNSNYACGIYMDGKSLGNVVTGNTVYQVQGAALMLNVTTSSHTVRNNTFYDNMYGFGYFPDTVVVSRNHRVTRNIFYAAALSQQGGILQTGRPPFIPMVGTLDSNYYYQPFEKDPTFVQTIASGFTPRLTRALTLSQWQALSYDPHSQRGTAYYPPVTIQSEGPIRLTNSNNSTFTTGLTVGSTAYTLTPASGTNVPTWDNTGQLDGGSLRLNRNDASLTASSRAVINVGTLTYGKYYRLRFSTKASQDSTALQIALLSAASSNFGVCKLKTTYASASRREIELLLSPNYTNTNTFLSFTLQEPQCKVWIDNVVFAELEVTENPVEDRVRFEVNPDSVSRTINLGSQTYTDVRGQTYAGSVTLAPYQSLILEKQVSAPLPLKLLNFYARGEDCQVRLFWNTAQERNISHFLIEYSPDGLHFTPMAPVSPGGNRRNQYSFALTPPAPGRGYYRLKIIDEDQTFEYSSLITGLAACPDSEVISIYPNPAQREIQVKLKEDRSALLRVSILSLTGQVMLAEQTASTAAGQAFSCNVESLLPGIYLLRVQEGSRVYFRKFVK